MALAPSSMTILDIGSKEAKIKKKDKQKPCIGIKTSNWKHYLEQNRLIQQQFLIKIKTATKMLRSHNKEIDIEM